MLQRMDQLVHEHEAERGRIGAPHTVQGTGFRIVESRHLLGVQIEQERLHVHRVGDEPEQPVHGLDPLLPRGREILVELQEQVGAHFLARGKLRAGGPAKVEPGGALHHRPEAVHQPGNIGILPARRGSPPAPGKQGQGGQEHRAPYATPRYLPYHAMMEGPTR